MAIIFHRFPSEYFILTAKIYMFFCRPRRRFSTAGCLWERPASWACSGWISHTDMECGKSHETAMVWNGRLCVMLCNFSFLSSLLFFSQCYALRSILFSFSRSYRFCSVWLYNGIRGIGRVLSQNVGLYRHTTKHPSHLFSCLH